MRYFNTDECWLALMVAILHPMQITPDKAFELLEHGPRQPNRYTACIDSRDIQEMIRLKEPE